jgi:serine/threonine protein kinase
LERVSSDFGDDAQSLHLSFPTFITILTRILGAFGNVRVGWQKSNKNLKYAIKTMKKAEIIKSKHVDHIENEKNILEKL